MDVGDFLCSGHVDWAGKLDQAELRLSRAGVPDVMILVAVRTHAEAVGVAIPSMMEMCNSKEDPSIDIKAVGHRVVHGGTSFRESTLVCQSVRKAIEELSQLAPLHNPSALAAIDAAELVLPGIPQVAVFDTAFFTSLLPQAFVYPVPYEWFSEWGIRRFGFHGISHSYGAHRAAEMLDRPLTDLRLVICHLGNGCSASAIVGGAPIATTMGFTPLDGLMMGTRSGAIDPGILVYLQRQHGLGPGALDDVLNHRSGLLGVSGISGDVRQLEAAAEAGHERAGLALTMFADRVRASIGALAVGMGGVDALVFTAGVGENSARVRADVCNGLSCLGLTLDAGKNVDVQLDDDIAIDSSSARILVIKSREDLMIARETERVQRLEQAC